MPSRPRIAISIALLGIAAAATAAFALKDLAFEEWHLRRLSSSNRSDRLHAIERLGDIGSPRAVPRLLESIDEDFENLDEELHQALIATLVRIGPRAIPTLHRALSSDRREIRCTAALALGRLAPEDRIRIDLHLVFLEDAWQWDGEERRSLMALKDLSPLPADVIERLVGRLKSEHPPYWTFDLLRA